MSKSWLASYKGTVDGRPATPNTVNNTRLARNITFAPTHPRNRLPLVSACTSLDAGRLGCSRVLQHLRQPHTQHSLKWDETTTKDEFVRKRLTFSLVSTYKRSSCFTPHLHAISLSV